MYFRLVYEDRYLPLSVDLELANHGWEHPQQTSDTTKRRRCHHVPGAGTPDTVVRLRNATLLHPQIPAPLLMDNGSGEPAEE